MTDKDDAPAAPAPDALIARLRDLDYMQTKAVCPELRLEAAAALAAQAQRIAELERGGRAAIDAGEQIIATLRDELQTAEAALRQAVPREPTEAMLDATMLLTIYDPVHSPADRRIFARLWRAMYDAAPAAPREKP